MATIRSVSRAGFLNLDVTELVAGFQGTPNRFWRLGVARRGLAPNIFPALEDRIFRFLEAPIEDVVLAEPLLEEEEEEWEEEEWEEDEAQWDSDDTLEWNFDEATGYSCERIN